MHFTKFILLCTSFCLISPASKSNEHNDCATLFSGLSLGVNSGFIHFSTKTRWVNHIPGITNNIGGRYSTTGNGGFIGVHSVIGHVFSQKCVFFHNYYLGGEVGASYNSLHGKSRDNINYGLVFRYSLKDSYTLALRTGVLAGKALIYIKGGAALTHRKVEVRFKNSQPLHSWKRSKKYKAGAMAGFGVDIPLQNNFSWGLEASYIHYPRDKFTYPTGATYKMKTSTFDVKLKVSYKI